MTADPPTETCPCRNVQTPERRELGVLFVIGLTFVMMVVEIFVGYSSHSMALLADGWHMSTHVGALGITALAYSISRRFATHRAFSFGTAKVNALGGFTSSLLLAVVAGSMVVESLARLLTPRPIDFAQSIPVAAIGLVVNLISILLLRDGTHVQHDHGQDDHGHRAALLHVMTDAFTSSLAIVALLLGRRFGLLWLDPATGIFGGLVILKWSFDLARGTALELLDVSPGGELEGRLRRLLTDMHDVNVLDLHVWPIGLGRMSCVVSIESSDPCSLHDYRSRILEEVPLAHLTVELRTTERPGQV